MDIKDNMKNTISHIMEQNITENETKDANTNINPTVGLISLGLSVCKYLDAKKN